VSVETAVATESEEVPKTGPSLLQSLVAAVVYPFERVLTGMVGAGFGIAAICLYLDLTRAALDLSLARLGLRTPHDRPLRKQSAKCWSIVDTRRLILWRQTGIHPDVIGVRLNRSANAVRGKARRLGIPAPDRKTLRRVDPWSLPDPAPGFGFPCPASAESSAPNANTHSSPKTHGAPPNADADDSRHPARPTTDAPPASLRGNRGRKTPAQRELPLLRVVPAEEPVSPQEALAPTQPVTTTPVLDAIAPGEISTATEPVGTITIAPATEATAPDLAASVAGNSVKAAAAQRVPAAPRKAFVFKHDEATTEDDDLTWVGKLQHVIYDKEAVRLIGMRQMGLEHWRTTASVLGLTPGQLKTIRTRIDLPIDRDRRKFGDTYDPELAQLNFDACGYTLMQERVNPNTGRDGHWFFRRNGSKDRLSLWTQLHVTGTIDKRTYDFSRVPVELLTSVHSRTLVKDSMQFMQGPDDEKRACRGHTPPVRSGFPGRPGDEMPWAYPGAGSAARRVAHP
jgi:hypothetical protein